MRILIVEDDAAIVASLTDLLRREGYETEHAAGQDAAAALLDAERFDAAPDHRAGALRFVRDDEEAGVYDDLGTSGMQSIQRAVEQMESPELLTLWKELRCHA